MIDELGGALKKIRNCRVTPSDDFAFITEKVPSVYLMLCGKVKGNIKKFLYVSKYNQSFSIIGYVLAYASYSLAQNVIHLYIFAFLLGVFYLNSTLIPVSMMVTNWFVKKRGLAMSFAMAGIGVGGFIFSPVITYLLEVFGWRSTYRIIALIILIIALPTSIFLLRKKPEDMGLEPYGANEEVATANKQPLKKEVKGILISVS